MASKRTADEVRAILEQQQRALVRVLKTDDGAQALEFLAAKYGGDVMERDPYQTHVRIGERRVVDYLLELREGRDDA